MTKEELAAKLNGSTYPLDLSKELTQAAKAARLVIVTGGSDDLIEFAGAIYDEAGAPGEILIDPETLQLGQSSADIDRDDEEVLKKYFVYDIAVKRLAAMPKIEALWCEEEGYSWTYKTNIPHATFDVWDDPETKYCRGLVFSLDDLK
jgi:hypothetical protein